MKYFETRIRFELFGFFKCQSVTDRRVDLKLPVDLRFGRFQAGGSVDAGPWTPLVRTYVELVRTYVIVNWLIL